MNNKKEQLKKAAAFVSALSFMSVTNFSGINNVSALTLSKVSAVNSGVDADSSITDEEQNDINVDAPVQDNQEESSEVSETPSENENPDIPNIDNKNDSSLMINVTNEEIRDVIVDKIKEEMSDLFNDVESVDDVIYLHYSKENEFAVNKAIKNFSYVTDDCIYVCVNVGYSSWNIREGYYRIYNYRSDIVEISEQDNENVRVEVDSSNNN
ncbi:MAG: hypothetical protein K2O29_09620, partial [Ruminococcus sp.]|nr:hypothetical protein [Ruminococcus sp.]